MTIIINDYTIRIDQEQEPGQELNAKGGGDSGESWDQDLGI